MKDAQGWAQLLLVINCRSSTSFARKDNDC